MVKDGFSPTVTATQIQIGYKGKFWNTQTKYESYISQKGRGRNGLHSGFVSLIITVIKSAVTGVVNIDFVTAALMTRVQHEADCGDMSKLVILYVIWRTSSSETNGQTVVQNVTVVKSLQFTLTKF